MKALHHTWNVRHRKGLWKWTACTLIYAQELNDKLIVFHKHFVLMCTQTSLFQFANSIRINSLWRNNTTEVATMCVFWDGVWSCVQPRINGGHIACCLTVQQAAWDSMGVAVCLGCVNNAPFSSSGHSAPFGTQSSLSSLPVLFTQRKPRSIPNKIIFGMFCSCVLTVTPAWLIASTPDEGAQYK